MSYIIWLYDGPENSFIGPFDTYWDAEEYIERLQDAAQAAGEDYTIMRLEAP